MAVGDTTRLGPWPAGMNNRQPDHALPDGTLRNAVNVDIDNRGKLRRRDGYVRVAQAVGAHSGFSCEAGHFFVDSGRLMRFNDDDSLSLVCAVSGNRIAYEYFDGILYFSDGVTARKLLADGTVMPWGFDAPTKPALFTAPGGLPAGRYLAAMTYVTADGIEHGASELAHVDCSSPSSIIFSALPQRNDATIRLYLSAANGKTLYRVGETAAGSLAVYVEPGSGAALDKLFISKPPAGSIIRQHNGRMYVADGKTLWHSDPFAFSHFRLAESFIQYEHDIAVIESVTAGLWVATSARTFILGGETAESPVQRQVAGYGALPGTSLKDEASGNAMWYSTRGAVTGTADGQIVNMQEANVAANGGERGAAVLRERDGLKQFIASVQGATVSPLAASSFIEMEVVRKAG